VAEIKIKTKKNDDGWLVEVIVREADGETLHTVTVPRVDYETLTGGQAAIDPFVKASFEFLLENESKEAILAKFDIMTIARYFPEYPAEITRRLGL